MSALTEKSPEAEPRQRQCRGDDSVQEPGGQAARRQVISSRKIDAEMNLFRKRQSIAVFQDPIGDRSSVDLGAILAPQVDHFPG